MTKTATTRRRPGGSAPPPDLEIRVTVETRGGETRLTYLLHSSSDRPGGFHYHTIRGQPLRAQPEDYHTALLKEIESLQAGVYADGSQALKEEVAADLAALGRKLYRELFPPEMRAAYRAFRKVVETLLITSDEPWIPWELVKPFDDGPPEPIDDDFLCSSFQLTRWLTGERGPADAIGVERLACIAVGEVPGKKPLPHADKELRWLQDLIRDRGIDDRSPRPAVLPKVKGLLEKGIDLVHFVGHACFDATDPDQSSFLLEDGRPLRPLDLFHGQIQRKTRGRRPLVFLNACQVAQQSYSLTGLGGWAPRWIGDCGCGAFVAPLWTVNDHLAHEFATRFYGALEDGQTFGEAAWIARQRVQELDPSGPTWLAFTIYAHPNGRLVLGRQPEAPSERPVLERNTKAAPAAGAVAVDGTGVGHALGGRNRGERGFTPPRTDPGGRGITRRERRFLLALLVALGISWTPRLYEPELGSTTFHPGTGKTPSAPTAKLHASEDAGGGAVKSEEPPASITRVSESGRSVRIQIKSRPGAPLSQSALEREISLGIAELLETRQASDSRQDSPCLVILDVGASSFSQFEEMTSCQYEVGYQILIDGTTFEEDLLYEIKSGFTQRAACVAAARKIGERAGERIQDLC